MTCYHPFQMFETGLKTEKGKKLLVLAKGNYAKYYNLKLAEKKLGVKIPLNPNYVYIDRTGEYLYKYVEAACGTCLGCRIDKSNEWANRCLMEAKTSKQTPWFITLTYESAPKELQKRDLQLFFKRLRNKYGEGIRYFACGEYGGKTLRPHYHAIIFNWKPEDLKPITEKFYKSDELTRIWGMGYTTIREADKTTMAYTARYASKKMLMKLPEGKEKPFLLMSRRPGIGSEYMKTNQKTTERTGRIYIKSEDKVIQTLPRYAKKLMEESNPERLEEIKKEGQVITNEKRQALISKWQTKSIDEIGFKETELAKANLERKKKIE